MLKITAIVSLMLIGSTLWAASLSCDSCGNECTSACGTRHFRSCCFNYLRRKRGPESLKFYTPAHDAKVDSQSKSRFPMFVVENIPMPEQWFSSFASNDYKSSPFEDAFENHMYDV